MGFGKQKLSLDCSFLITSINPLCALSDSVDTLFSIGISSNAGAFIEIIASWETVELSWVYERHISMAHWPGRIIDWFHFHSRVVLVTYWGNYK
jgi:hypothetical protein